MAARLWLIGAVISTALALPSHAAVITVGPGGDFTTLAAAIGAANANDEIDIAAGNYLNDFATINVPLTIIGVGGLAVLRANMLIPNGKAILVTRADVTIRNLEFRDATVTDNNGAGIRHELGDLTIENSVFRHNQDGILAATGVGIDIVVRGTSFIDNGFGDGLTHALYVNGIDSLLVENSSFAGTKVGHDIKSRATSTTVLGNVLDDGESGTTSYAVDISNCGLARIKGNTITQGVNTQNPSMVAYGAEGCSYATNSLLVENNSFINFRPGSSVGVANFTTTVSAVLNGNTFQGVATPLFGPGTINSDPGTDPDPAPVPAPGGVAVLALGLCGFAALRRRVHPS